MFPRIADVVVSKDAWMRSWYRLFFLHEDRGTSGPNSALDIIPCTFPSHDNYRLHDSSALSDQETGFAVHLPSREFMSA